jgi:hypothetical protein
MITPTWRAYVRRLLGGALYCPYCRERLDVGLPVLAIPSPSRLQAEHVASCSVPGARVLQAFAEIGRALQETQAKVTLAFEQAFTPPDRGTHE